MTNMLIRARIIAIKSSIGIIQSIPVQDDKRPDIITNGKRLPMNIIAMLGAIEDMPLYSARIGIVEIPVVFMNIARRRKPLTPKNIKEPEMASITIIATNG